jgi:hypothetical protein
MVLSQKEADVQMMLAADVHLGTKNCDFQMERYVWKRRSDGMHPLPHFLRLSLSFSCLSTLGQCCHVIELEFFFSPLFVHPFFIVFVNGKHQR